MFAFGVWYLISEMKILSRDLEREPVAIDRISKVLLTSQVRHSGEILLSNHTDNLD